VNYALILAGGKGYRFGSQHLSKQFVKLDNKPLYIHSLLTAQENKNIDEIVLVVDKKYWSEIEKTIKNYSITKAIHFADSGSERYDSVFNGLKKIKSLGAKAQDTVMILTSACPLVSQKVVDQHFAKIKNYDGLITCIISTDAISISQDGQNVDRTLQKTKIYIQQGPHLYHFKILYDAHQSYQKATFKPEITEDSELILSSGGNVGIVMGDRYCLKITYPEDLVIVKALYPLFKKEEKNYESGKANL